MTSPSILTFGKYKNQNIEDIIKNDISYCKWLYERSTITLDEDIKLILENIFKDKNEHYLTFGKYKNKSLSWVKENDNKYIDYLKKCDYVKDKMESLYKSLQLL